ncbi:hypothetical protein [Fodinicola feengrottensis]|uniref:Methionine synthase n=1 Tax=Fodinicola feengrottensis TaxID=435914 RepID=A0ABN2JDV3_9ACTN|nr:hypothetical protein [Fodinicola feengrottensis]
MAAARAVHTVGSMPLDLHTAEETMRLTLDSAGPLLRSLSDGEPGRNYVQPVVDGLDGHPALRKVNAGDWSTMNKRTMYKVKRGHTLREKPLDDYLLYLTSAIDNWPIFLRLREEYQLPELSYQVGLPTDFVLSFIAFGPGGAFSKENHRAFLEATERGIHRIHELAGDQVIFQVETPAETLLSANAPGPVRPVAARLLAKGVARIAQQAPIGARFGIHVCLGSLTDDAPAGPRTAGQQTTVRNAGQLTSIVNATKEIWPADRPLEFVHLPLLTDRGEGFYRGLDKLEVGDTRIAAGIVREEIPFDEQRRTLEWVESRVGRQVDISPSCGLGRRPDATAAKAALDRAVALAES